MTAPVTFPQGKSPLARARRVIVKIGSALLVDQASGDIRRAWLDALADDVAALHALAAGLGLWIALTMRHAMRTRTMVGHDVRLKPATLVQRLPRIRKDPAGSDVT